MWMKLQCRSKLITSYNSFEWHQNMNCCLFYCHVLIIPDSSHIARNKGLRSRSSTEKPWDSGLYIVFAVCVWVYCSSPWQCASLNCNIQLTHCAHMESERLSGFPVWNGTFLSISSAVKQIFLQRCRCSVLPGWTEPQAQAHRDEKGPLEVSSPSPCSKQFLQVIQAVSKWGLNAFKNGDLTTSGQPLAWHCLTSAEMYFGGLHSPSNTSLYSNIF